MSFSSPTPFYSSMSSDGCSSQDTCGIIFRLLIDYVSDPNGQLHQGIFYALTMFIVSELRSLMVNYYFFIMYRMGIKVQVCFQHYAYQLNSSSKFSDITHERRLQEGGLCLTISC